MSIQCGSDIRDQSFTMAKQLYSFRIEAELLNDLKELAKEKETTVSELIHKLIRLGRESMYQSQDALHVETYEALKPHLEPLMADIEKRLKEQLLHELTDLDSAGSST